MKRSSKKLSLSKETLARLDSRRLEGAAGGTTIRPPFTGGSELPDCASNNGSCNGSCACGGSEACQTVTCNFLTCQNCG